jgi:hypothetical protein
MRIETGIAAGVPYVALPPASGSATDAVVAWHMLDAPRTEAAFAAALPLAELDAWRIHLGLPRTGARMPAGGMEEFMRLGAEDAVLNVYGPVFTQAADEFPAAWSALRERLGLDAIPSAVVGGSLGGAIAAEVLTRSEIPRAALVNPVLQLAPLVAAIGAQYGIEYAWTEEASEIAARIDFVARAGELAGRDLLLVVGEDDDASITEPAAALAELTVIPDLAHALAEEPGFEPAPQTPGAAAVDRVVTEWLR